jgi:glycosyltransferase involved in cell wall biosynthesis
MKKIAILGPVNSNKYFGGVAIFTENVANSFYKKGFETKIFSLYSDRKNFEGVEIISSKKSGLKLFSLYRKIKEFNPDIIISSLNYGVYNYLTRNKKIKTFFILHGFPVHETKFLKKFKILLGYKIFTKYSEYTISNSNFTSVINKEIYGIESNYVFNIGMNKKTENNENTIKKEKNTIFFAGRFVKEKKINLIITALSKLNNKIHFYLAGDGEEKENILKLLKEKKISYDYLGKISQNEIKKYYKKSEIFISLNPHEPFGIVFLEALSYNCKIIAPEQGGHLDIYKKYPERFFLCNPYNEKSIYESIHSSLSSKKIEKTINISKDFSYDRFVDNIIKIIREDDNNS